MPWLKNDDFCCGIEHIVEFNEDEFDIEELDSYKEAIRGAVPGRLIVVTLNDHQCSLKGPNNRTWPSTLKNNGFKLVKRWANPTGSICNLFTCVKPRDGKHGSGKPYGLLSKTPAERPWKTRF